MTQWPRARTLTYLDGIAIQMAVNWVGQSRWIPESAAAIMVAAITEAKDTTDEFEPEVRQVYRQRSAVASISDQFQSMTSVQARFRLDQIRVLRVERTYIDRVNLAMLGDPRVFLPLHGTALEKKFELVDTYGSLFRAEVAAMAKEQQLDRSVQGDLRVARRKQQDWTRHEKATAAMLRELRTYKAKVVSEPTPSAVRTMTSGICKSCGARNQFHRICRVCRRVQK